MESILLLKWPYIVLYTFVKIFFIYTVKQVFEVSKCCLLLCPAGQIRFLSPAHSCFDQKQMIHTHKHVYSHTFPHYLHRQDAIKGPNHVTSERGKNVSSQFLCVKQQDDQRGQRPYHTNCPIVSSSILGIMNTRLWLEPGSDPCLKSTEQQSQQAMGAQIANYGECQQAARHRIKALFVWCGWSPLYSSGHGLSSTPLLDPWLNTTDYFWSHRYFRSTSSHRWSLKLIFSSLNPTLIILAFTPPLYHSQWFVSPLVSRANPRWLTFLTQMRVVPTTLSGECLRCN